MFLLGPRNRSEFPRFRIQTVPNQRKHQSNHKSRCRSEDYENDRSANFERFDHVNRLDEVHPEDKIDNSLCLVRPVSTSINAIRQVAAQVRSPPSRHSFARSSWAPVQAVAAEEDQHHQHYLLLIQIKALKRPEDAELANREGTVGLR